MVLVKYFMRTCMEVSIKDVDKRPKLLLCSILEGGNFKPQNKQMTGTYNLLNKQRTELLIQVRSYWEQRVQTHV